MVNVIIRPEPGTNSARMVSGSVNAVMLIYDVYWFMVPVLRCVLPKIRMTD